MTRENNRNWTRDCGAIVSIVIGWTSLALAHGGGHLPVHGGRAVLPQAHRVGNAGSVPHPFVNHRQGYPRMTTGNHWAVPGSSGVAHHASPTGSHFTPAQAHSIATHATVAHHAWPHTSGLGATHAHMIAPHTFHAHVASHPNRVAAGAGASFSGRYWGVAGHSAGLYGFAGHGAGFYGWGDGSYYGRWLGSNPPPFVAGGNLGLNDGSFYSELVAGGNGTVNVPIVVNGNPGGVLGMDGELVNGPSGPIVVPIIENNGGGNGNVFVSGEAVALSGDYFNPERPLAHSLETESFDAFQERLDEFLASLPHGKRPDFELGLRRVLEKVASERRLSLPTPGAELAAVNGYEILDDVTLVFEGTLSDGASEIPFRGLLTAKLPESTRAGLLF